MYWGVAHCASWDRSYISTAATATFTTREHRAAGSHIEQAHTGADGEHSTLRRMPAPYQPVLDSSNTDFLAMHDMTFIEAFDPLEATTSQAQHIPRQVTHSRLFLYYQQRGAHRH
jgi:hypothetical protein